MIIFALIYTSVSAGAEVVLFLLYGLPLSSMIASLSIVLPLLPIWSGEYTPAGFTFDVTTHTVG